MKILITGTAGFIGSHLARKCVEAGHEVYALLKPSTDTSRVQDILSRLHCISGDLSDQSYLEKILDEIKPAGIFHLAASTIMSGVTASPEEVVKNNIFGTVNLVNAASEKKLKFFVYTSSFLEYAPQKRAVKESDLCEPWEIYSISKLAGTLYIKAMSRSKNMPVCALRVFTPYGPALQKGRLVREIIEKALLNKDITLTDTEVTRDFIYVENLCDLYLEAAKNAKAHAGEIFNAGSGKAVTLKELAEKILKMTGSKSKIIWGALPQVSYDSAFWQADMQKTFSAFSWRPKYDLAQGLQKTIEWYKNNTHK